MGCCQRRQLWAELKGSSETSWWCWANCRQVRGLHPPEGGRALSSPGSPAAAVLILGGAPRPLNLRSDCSVSPQQWLHSHANQDKKRGKYIDEMSVQTYLQMVKKIDQNMTKCYLQWESLQFHWSHKGSLNLLKTRKSFNDKKSQLNVDAWLSEITWTYMVHHTNAASLRTTEWMQ